VVPYITHAFEWNGVVRDLGALPQSDSNCSTPFGINAKGEIVGASEGAEIDPVVGTKGAHAVLWKDGEINDLGSLGGNEVAAFGINNRGQIIGNSTNTIPDPYCFFGTVQNRAFLWEHGQMQDLGTLGGNCAGVGGLNEHGQIVGGSTTSAIANPVTGFPPQDPFLWESGRGMTDLGTLGGAFGAAQGINNRGEVIGQSSIASDPGACSVPDNGDLNCHAFLWDNGTLIDLTTRTMGGAPEFVAAINDAGEIVGWGVFPNAPMEAFLWRKGVATDLGNLGECASIAHTINARGQVVGLAFSCDGNAARAFLWENGSIVDLNVLILPGSSLQLADAMDINERGEIDGIGVPPGVPSGNFITQGHGFLLIPCDDDHPGIEGCDYSAVEESAVAATHMPADSGPHKELTPQEIIRIRALLMNRHRALMPRRAE
jgi:probable HAF family extracellular repeat protein